MGQYHAPTFRHPNRHVGRMISNGQRVLGNTTANLLSPRSTYHAPQPRTVLVRVKGRQEPFDPAIICYWMNGKGKPNFYTPVQFTD